MRYFKFSVHLFGDFALRIKKIKSMFYVMLSRFYTKCCVFNCTHLWSSKNFQYNKKVDALHADLERMGGLGIENVAIE